MKARYHRAATEELTSATEWYEAQRPGLGLDFLGEVTRVVAAIVAHPETWPLWQGVKTAVPVRKFLLRRFPFSLPYVVHEETVVLLAVAHGSRRPGYWRARLRDVP